jgi:hypothetical protein
MRASRRRAKHLPLAGRLRGRLVRLAGDAESINRPTQIQDLLDVQ